MTFRQALVATGLVVGVFIFFAGMWSPTPFGVGDAPSTYDGTDEFGFPLRHRRVPSGECDTPGCAEPITSTSRLAANGVIFVAVVSVCVVVGRAVA